MKAYETASETIKELERTLSLNKNASIDTSLRKLQSILRNNAYTNYGRRQVLAEMLVDAGATSLMERLAGQTLNTLKPRGLESAVAGGIAAGGIIEPNILYALPFKSPRIMGEVAHKIGQLSRPIPPGLVSGTYQTGRAGRLQEEERR